MDGMKGLVANLFFYLVALCDLMLLTRQDVAILGTGFLTLDDYRHRSGCESYIFSKDGTGSVDEIKENSDENMSEEVKLVSRVFSENVELMSCYEKNFEGGDFIYLFVCELLGWGFDRLSRRLVKGRAPIVESKCETIIRDREQYGSSRK